MESESELLMCKNTTDFFSIPINILPNPSEILKDNLHLIINLYAYQHTLDLSI